MKTYYHAQLFLDWKGYWESCNEHDDKQMFIFIYFLIFAPCILKST